VVAAFKWKHKNPSIADVSRSGNLDHELHNVIDPVIVSDDLDHHFVQERLLVLYTSIKDRVSLLAAYSFGIRHSHAGRQAVQCWDYFIEFVRLDNAFYQLHETPIKKLSGNV
jgi:hypothetical protein